MLVLLLSAWDGLGRLMMFCVFVLFSCTFEIVCFGQTDILFRSSCWLKLTLVSQWVSWFYIVMTARELFKANRFNIALNSECNLCRIKDSFAVFTDGIVHLCLFCLCRNVVYWQKVNLYSLWKHWCTMLQMYNIILNCGHTCNSLMQKPIILMRNQPAFFISAREPKDKDCYYYYIFCYVGNVTFTKRILLYWRLCVQKAVVHCCTVSAAMCREREECNAPISY